MDGPRGLPSAPGGVKGGDQKVPPTAAPGPLSPTEERATFRSRGFRVELVACEPDVVDPVAMAFDEDGRLFVAEMRGYPNGGVGTGNVTSGRIKMLEDRDGDGFYENGTVFAEGLRFPDVGDALAGRAARRQRPGPPLPGRHRRGRQGRPQPHVLYTGFDLANIQQMVNSLQWGLDNWVYGCAGSNGGTIRSAEKPEAPAVTLRGRGIRFHPEMPGSLEPTSGGGQYGLAADEWQHWFTATNSQHLRHIVLPDHYLRRNPLSAGPRRHARHPRPRGGLQGLPHQPVRGVARRADHAAQAAGRTPSASRRRNWCPAATSPRRAARWSTRPTCFPADVSRQHLRLRPGQQPRPPRRPGAERAPRSSPSAPTTGLRVPGLDRQLVPAGPPDLGPDGALYVLDFYREVIETPLSLPDDIKKKLNLESRGRGRIWRDRAGWPRGRQSKPPCTRRRSTELVQAPRPTRTSGGG